MVVLWALQRKQKLLLLQNNHEKLIRQLLTSENRKNSGHRWRAEMADKNSKNRVDLGPVWPFIVFFPKFHFPFYSLIFSYGNNSVIHFLLTSQIVLVNGCSKIIFNMHTILDLIKIS